MSPEQTRGGTIDRRTDVWAAGVVAWQIIAGRKLYRTDDNEVATLLKIATEPPPRLREVKPSVPQAFDDAVAKALTMNAEDRWPTAQTFKQALQAACRAHGETAESEEVAAFVSRMVEPLLVERRARAAEIVELRAKMERLAGAPEASLPTTTPVTRAPEDAVTVALATKAPLAVPPIESTVSVATTSVSAKAAPAGDASRKTWAAAGGAGLVAAATAAIVLMASTHRSPHVLASPVASVTPKPASVASNDATSAAIAPLAVEPISARPLLPAPAHPPARLRKLRQAPAAASSDLLLPRSPYEDKAP